MDCPGSTSTTSTCVNSFIECTSLSIGYSIMGVATVSYTMVHNNPSFCYVTTITAGGQTFSGYVSSMTLKTIPNTAGWYETSVVLTTTTN